MLIFDGGGLLSLRKSAMVTGFLLPAQSPSISLVRPRAMNQETTDANDASTRQCPFVKFFPRYRIELSRQRSKTKTESPPWLPVAFKDIGKSLQRAKIEQQLQAGEEHVWMDNVNGISALAKLWRYADRLQKCNNNNNNNSVVVSLPDASPSLIQNWIEIFTWMLGNYPWSNNSCSGWETTIIRSSESDPGTTVRIQRHVPLSTDRQGSGVDPSTTWHDWDHETIVRRTQAWVKRILVEQGICPFTKSVTKSGQGLADVGVPVASIAYHASAATNPISLLADTFEAIEDMIQAGPSGKSGVSSILLAAPAFDDNFDVWSGPIFTMLEASVVAAMAESQIGVVCFHPYYAIPDGSSWPGFGHMHSVTRLQKWYQEAILSTGNNYPILSMNEIAAGGAWQRRTPHATINVLRADQLEAAEAKRSSGDLYAMNINKLVGEQGIGSDRLARDLEQERQLE